MIAASITILVVILPLFKVTREWISKKVGSLFTREIEVQLKKTNLTLYRINRTAKANHKEGIALIRELTERFDQHESNGGRHGGNLDDSSNRRT